MKRFYAIACAAAILAFLLAASLPAAFAAGELSGKVLETMDSGGYTYILLGSGGGKTWVALPKTNVAKGQTITVRPGMEMHDFESKTLKRKFERIIFSDGLATAESAGKNNNAASAGAVVVPATKVKVEKAAGPDAYTVAEVFKLARKLDKKTVHVRGTVVKVSQGIMGRNWLHIQDGTGLQNKGTHDLVVTSKETATPGAIVTASGKIARNRDFGSNYKYKVIMEDASLKK